MTTASSGKEPTVARLSVPPSPLPARALTDPEHRTILAAADALIPAVGENPSASQAPDYETWLARAISARAEQLDVLTAALASLDGLSGPAMYDALRTQHREDPEAFRLLSAVVAGAYLMVPEVRALVGYRGQTPNVPRVDEAASQLEDGILDAVVERGPVYIRAVQ